MSKGICLQFPIRPKYRAEIVVPDDLTAKEAQRLCAFVSSLAVPETVLCQDGFGQDALRLRAWFIGKDAP